MENQETPEQLKPLLRGDKVLRVRRRRPRRRLRFTPDIPGVIRFLKQIATETPLVPLTFAMSHFGWSHRGVSISPSGEQMSR